MRLAAILAALPFIAATAIAQQTIENGRHGYTIEIPKEWHEVPSEFLTEFSRSVSKPDRPINYVQAFQKEAFDGALIYPYILIQSIPYRDVGLDRPPTTVEMATIVESIIGVDLSGVLQDRPALDLPEFAENDSAIQRLSFDGRNGEFAYSLNLAVESMDDIHGRARGVFGRRAMIQTAIFDSESDWVDTQSVADLILNSFAFTADYAYPDERVPSEDGREIISFGEGTHPWLLPPFAVAAVGVLIVLTTAAATSATTIAIRAHFRRK